MKTACTITAMLGALGCIEAFILPSSHMPVRQKTARSAERINEKIELEKPKVRACFGVLLQRKAGVDLATDVAKGFNSCALYRQGRAVLKGCKVMNWTPCNSKLFTTLFLGALRELSQWCLDEVLPE